MTERLLHSVRLASVRTAPPGYNISTCQGTLCQVTTERLIVPGATYGSETPLELIGQCDAVLDGGDIKFCVVIDTPHYYMTLCCNNQQECEQLAKAIRKAAGFKNP